MNWMNEMDAFARENAPKPAPLTPEQVAQERAIFRSTMDAYEANEAANRHYDMLDISDADVAAVWGELQDVASYVEQNMAAFASADLSYLLFPVQTIGCYYTDADGNPWTTFDVNNGTQPCSDCGKEISRGYCCGKWGEETYHCGTHIEHAKR